MYSKIVNPYNLKKINIKSILGRKILQNYLLKTKIGGNGDTNRKKVAIHTVFIVRENILFLEEWLMYHCSIGFDTFYLYDNSKVEINLNPWDLRFSPKYIAQKTNKYGINYSDIVNLTDEEVYKRLTEIINRIQTKVPNVDIKLIEWSPIDPKTQKIEYKQTEAHNECLKKLKQDKIDWCASIDIDEFIKIRDFDNIKDYINSLDKNIACCQLGMIQFENRWFNLDKKVLDITNKPKKTISRNTGNKNIFRVNDTRKLTVHKWLGNNRNVIKITPPIEEICFYHYNSKTKCRA